MPQPKDGRRSDTPWPPKLSANSPLLLHPRGYRARIAGRMRWIAGKIPPAAALRIYHRKAAALVGKVTPLPEPKPLPVGAIVTLHYVLAKWILDRRGDVERGELKVGTWAQYKLSARRIDEVAGQWVVDEWTPDQTRALYDALSKSHGNDFAKRGVGHLRDACRYAADHGWCLPVRMGDRVVRQLTSRPAPSMKWKLYTPAQVRQILAECDRRIAGQDGRTYVASWQQLKAMILLALNGGFGAMELSELTKGQVDLAGARLSHQRGKTGAAHLVPLWSETVEALRPVLALRPGDTLLFRTRSGAAWCRAVAVVKGGKVVKVSSADNCNWCFRALVKPLGLKRKGEGFYKLKALHCTVADRGSDPHATFALAGHELPGAKSFYVRVDEDRLRKLSEFIRHELLLKPLPPRES